LAGHRAAGTSVNVVNAQHPNRSSGRTKPEGSWQEYGGKTERLEPQQHALTEAKGHSCERAALFHFQTTGHNQIRLEKGTISPHDVFNKKAVD